MGEEPGFRSRAISCDHSGEVAIAWSTRWAKKQDSVLKPFPVTIVVK